VSSLPFAAALFTRPYRAPHTLARSTFAVRQDDVRHVGRRGHRRRQIREGHVETEANALRQNDGTFDDIPELADVAGPVVLLEPCGIRLGQGGRLYS